MRVDEKEAVTSVIDSGVGIKAEDLPQVFDEFFRSAESTLWANAAPAWA